MNETKGCLKSDKRLTFLVARLVCYKADAGRIRARIEPTHHSGSVQVVVRE